MITLHDWSGCDKYGILRDFLEYDDRESKGKMKELLGEGNKILFATYTYENYSGDAFVLIQNKEGKLFEVNGSHCSCYGLEGQWDPEEVSVKDLRYRIENGRLGVSGWDEYKQNVFAKELLEVLAEYENKDPLGFVDLSPAL